MITSLTPEQESKFKEYINRWIAIGLCTDPVDKPKAEEVIKKCYEKGGLEAPKKIIWCGSPFSQAMTRAILINIENDFGGKSISASLRRSIIDSVRDSISASVANSVSASVNASICDPVWDSVGRSVRDSIMESIGNSVMAVVWNSISDSVRDSVYGSGNAVWDSVSTFVRAPVIEAVWDSIRTVVWDPVSVKAVVWDSVKDPLADSGRDFVCGSHEACWLSFYSFMREELGLVEQTEPITGLLELVLHCGWILPCEGICFASERHNVLKRDERGRLHCTDGPAVSYPDGWNIYAIHGVRVPEYVVTSPREIMVEKIEEEENAEVRRVMIDIYGQNRYMEDSGATLIHEDNYGKLYKKDLQDDEPIVMVKVVNSTAEPNGTFKEYFLRVPPGTKTAHEAVAWTFGKEDKTYNPMLET